MSRDSIFEMLLWIAFLAAMTLFTQMYNPAEAVEAECDTDMDCYSKCLDSGKDHKECEIEA